MMAFNENGTLSSTWFSDNYMTAQVNILSTNYYTSENELFLLLGFRSSLREGNAPNPIRKWRHLAEVAGIFPNNNSFLRMYALNYPIFFSILSISSSLSSKHFLSLNRERERERDYIVCLSFSPTENDLCEAVALQTREREWPLPLIRSFVFDWLIGSNERVCMTCRGERRKIGRTESDREIEEIASAEYWTRNWNRDWVVRGNWWMRRDDASYDNDNAI